MSGFTSLDDEPSKLDRHIGLITIGLITLIVLVLTIGFVYLVGKEILKVPLREWFLIIRFVVLVIVVSWFVGWIVVKVGKWKQ